MLLNEDLYDLSVSLGELSWAWMILHNKELHDLDVTHWITMTRTCMSESRVNIPIGFS